MINIAEIVEVEKHDLLMILMYIQLGIINLPTEEQHKGFKRLNTFVEKYLSEYTED